MSAADLLSTLIVILAWRNVQSAEIEASYMWGLIDHSFLVGDSRYFLMTLSSAVERLKAVRNTIENLSLGDRSVSGVDHTQFASVFGRATQHLLRDYLSVCPSVTLVSHAQTVQDIEMCFAPYYRERCL